MAGGTAGGTVGVDVKDGRVGDIGCGPTYILRDEHSRIPYSGRRRRLRTRAAH